MTISKVLTGVGLPRICRRINHGAVLILMYHGVLPDEDSLANCDWLQVRCSEFSAQMAYLRQHYEPVCLIDVLKNETSRSQKPQVVVTFDDGYANNLHHAYPILQHFDVPATIFLATAFVDTHRLFWWDRLHLSLQNWGQPLNTDWPARLKKLPPAKIDQTLDAEIMAITGQPPLLRDTAPESYRALSVEEIQRLKKGGGIDFGSHTHEHEILENLSDAQLLKTLSEASRLLSAWGVESHLFAAPNGNYLERQIHILKSFGLSCCVSTEEGLWHPRDGCYRIPRIGIGRDMPIEKFALHTSGAMHALKFWK